MKNEQRNLGLPLEAWVLNDDDMLVLKGGYGVYGSGNGCGCGCRSGEGCACETEKKIEEKPKRRRCRWRRR